MSRNRKEDCSSANNTKYIGMARDSLFEKARHYLVHPEAWQTSRKYPHVFRVLATQYWFGEDPAVGTDDVVSTFFLRVADDSRMGREMDWASLPLADVKALIQRRMRNAADELRSDRNRYRSLRSHVAAVLNGPLPPPPPALPGALCKNGRLQRESVTAAVSFLVSAGSRRDARGLTAELHRRYEPATVSLTSEDPGGNAARGFWHDDDRATVEDLCDAAEFGRALSRVEPMECHIRRWLGWGYERVARAESVSTSTAFERVRMALERLGRLIRAKNVSLPAVRAALDALGAAMDAAEPKAPGPRGTGKRNAD